MAVLRTGQLRRLVTIETPTEGVDSDTGQPTETWAAFARRVPVSIESTGGREPIRGEGIDAVAIHRVRMRWLSGVTTSMRLTTDDSRTLNIESVGDPDGRRRELVLLCREDVE